MEADVEENPEHLVDINVQVRQAFDFGIYYTKTILERALYEMSEAITAALTEAGYDDALELVPTLPVPGSYAETRPEVSEEEYARFLELFTSDETESVVAAVVNAKFPEQTTENRFLREHFTLGSTKSMEKEYREILDLLAEVKEMLPANCDSAIVALFF